MVIYSIKIVREILPYIFLNIIVRLHTKNITIVKK